MSTVIIPLKNNNQYDQLRFALRSITKHHPEITECILVGGKPPWYTGKHIPFKDYGPVFKEANIRDKVLVGSQLIGNQQGQVGADTGSTPFLFANDDHILMAPISSTWNKGLLSHCLSKRIGNGSYTRCLRNTFEHYGDVDNVDIHCPMWMTGEGVKKTNFEWPEFGIGFKTCYAVENGVASEYMEDCKTAVVPVNREWFSLTDNFPLQNLTQYFPERSIFEL